MRRRRRQIAAAVKDDVGSGGRPTAIVPSDDGMEVVRSACTVGDVSRLAHVSVRTLHHYDEIGLLVPSVPSDAGYRLYTPEDLGRLQQILFYRELGFGLQRIRDLMADPAFDPGEALLEQRGLVAARIDRLRALLALIDRTMASRRGVIRMSKEELFAVFGDFDPAEHEDETRRRWGDTDAYRESARRCAGYTGQDWKRFKSESDEVNAGIAAVMDEGLAPDHPRTLEAVERHRLLIDRWFYPCSRTMHAELGRMYVTDPRFSATFEKVRPGMAELICAATKAQAERRLE